jgi:hypothetical protein
MSVFKQLFTFFKALCPIGNLPRFYSIFPQIKSSLALLHVALLNNEWYCYEKCNPKMEHKIILLKKNRAFFKLLFDIVGTTENKYKFYAIVSKKNSVISYYKQLIFENNYILLYFWKCKYFTPLLFPSIFSLKILFCLSGQSCTLLAPIRIMQSHYT